MITLKKNADRRIRRGGLWVFSNEIAEPEVSDLEPGRICELRDHAGEFMGMVYANPKSLICARILSRRREPIDADFLEARITQAFERRKRLFPERDFYRVVYGESDLLPGLIVDRYGDCLAAQTLTAGMDALKDLVVEALVSAMAPSGIYWRNDSRARSLEGLNEEKAIAYGVVPDTVTVGGDPVRYVVDIPNGQKTGFFLDQESNRDLVRRLVPPDTEVLDLFSYSGAWGLRALAAGAGSVVAVDSSRGALDLADKNARLNGFEDRLTTVRDTAVDFLKKEKKRWDVVILDPPSFIRARSRKKDGLKGYFDVNRRAMVRMKEGGLLVTCSCSHHLDAEGFQDMLHSASRQAGRNVRVLSTGGHGPDHPVLLGMPETRYLKVIAAEVF